MFASTTPARHTPTVTPTPMGTPTPALPLSSGALGAKGTAGGPKPAVSCPGAAGVGAAGWTLPSWSATLGVAWFVDGLGGVGFGFGLTPAGKGAMA